MHQNREIREITGLLAARFTEFDTRPDVSLDDGSFICYDPSNLNVRVSPDVYLVVGVDAEAIRPRSLYLPWAVGKPPDFALEVASESTSPVDTNRKPGIYAAIRVSEFWRFDPSGGQCYGETLWSGQLVDGVYQTLPLTTEPDGILKVYSPLLRISLCWDEGWPLLYDPATGTYSEIGARSTLPVSPRRSNGTLRGRRLNASVKNCDDGMRAEVQGETNTMLNDPQEFLRYFDSIHRRTLRDIEALPPPAEDWAPPVGEGEKSWSIAQIVHHICESRMYFARAYRNEGWLYDWPVPSTEQQSGWIPALEESHAEFHRRLDDTPPEWLRRRIKMIDTDGTLSGWRILMMLIEHEVHHRSQIDTYSGLNGWDVPQIYGRTRERIDELQESQRGGA